MKDHAQFAEDLPLYAMGALDARHCPELEAHLAACGECRRELEALRADMALLALSATGPQPPQRSRQRLMEAIAAGRREDPELQAPAPPQRAWPRWLFWAPLAACVLLVVHTVFLWNANRSAHREYEKVQAELQRERVDNLQAKAILKMLNSPTVQRMTLVSASARPEPQIKMFYEKKEGHVLLVASNLEMLPADKRYELWLIPMSGAPMPCGTFRVESDGSAVMMHAMESEGIEAKAFAITVEPLHGSDTPTMPIRFAPPG